MKLPPTRASTSSVMGALLLTVLAATVAWIFRSRGCQDGITAMTWDAASHALAGLDLSDNLRTGRVLDALRGLLGEHWWPPLFGLLSLPFFALRRQFDSASYVSLVAYCLQPAAAWLASGARAGGTRWAAAILTAAFFSSSPLLIQMSSWTMLETTAGAFAIVSLGLFTTKNRRAGRWALGLAGASTLLKYHYGTFLLGTLAVGALLDLEREERAGLRALARRLARSRLLCLIAAVVLLGLGLRAVLGGTTSGLPSVPNIVWAGYVSVLVLVAFRWNRVRPIWGGVPGGVRDWVTYGVSWPALWCLDPANVRAWYRELTVTTAEPATVPAQLSAIVRFALNDYVLGRPMQVLVIGGLVAAACMTLLRGSRWRGTILVVHTLWPLALMSLGSYAMEARFLGAVVPVAFAAAIAGWVGALERTAPSVRGAGALVLGVCGLSFFCLDLPGWSRELATRRPYPYRYPAEADAFLTDVARAVGGASQVAVVLPEDVPVAPTLRLAIRIANRNVAPALVNVETGDVGRLVELLEGATGCVTIGAEISPVELGEVLAGAGLAPPTEVGRVRLPVRDERYLTVAETTAYHR